MPIKINVAELMAKHKMSMKQLSDITAIRPSTISALYYEEAKRIQFAQMAALCKALNCKIEDLFEYISD